MYLLRVLLSRCYNRFSVSHSLSGTVGLQRIFSGLQPNLNEDEALRQFASMIPMQRLGTINDVANVCLFMCLPEASYITGTTIVVDGGQWLSSSGYALFSPQIKEAWAQKGQELPQIQDSKCKL